jgi:transcription elongation factor Elf1
MRANDLVYLDENLNSENLEKYEVGIITRSEEDFVEVDFIKKNKHIRLQNNLLIKFEPMYTGDLYQKKVCNVCHKYLDTELFDINQVGKGDRIVRRPSCKFCRIEIDGAALLIAERNRMNRMKPELKKFTCPICEKTTIAGFTSKVVIDHDHITGYARSWICDSCNTGLGRFKDSVELLNKAIDYLTKHKV